jgi:outer membrane protein assembly factor BamB
MVAVFRHLRATYERHRQATMRVGVALLATALGLLVIGGAIRVLRAADRDPRPTAATGSPSAEWRATVDTPVTGLAIDDGRLYVAGDQLTGFPVSCAVTAGRCVPRWRGVVPDGPLSVPTVRDEWVFVGSLEGQLYAFPSTCDGEGCSPEWVGVAGDGPVSQPAANFDLVYVTSDELYAFPVGCASEDLACPAAWSADVPGRPAAGPPALGGGLVIVASSSTRGGVAAYPAVCGDDCEPVWTGRTDGPATAVAIGEGLAFTVARGQLMAFSLSCTGRCEPEWRAPFVPGAPFATGATSAPAVVDGRVLVGDDQGRLWVFRSACDQARCDPVDSYEVATTPLYTPAVDGDRVIVTSANGALARVLLDCRADESCDPVRVRKLAGPASAPAVIAPEATIAGTQDGSLEAFKW